MTEEHKLKMKEARERSRLEKENKKTGAKVGFDSGASTPLDAKLDAVLRGIDTLAGAVGKLIDLQTAEKLEPAKKDMDLTYTPALEDETYPASYIPPKFRKIVSDILSPEFGLQIIDFADRTDFQINILVPDRFSSVSPEDKAKGVTDIRSRMIPRALGENGVREWCTLIRRNLNRFYQKEGITVPFTNVTI